MKTRTAIALLATGIAAATTFATESGATPPGAPTATTVNFTPDALGAKPVPWSPAQLAELDYFSAVSVVNVGGNRAIQYLNAVDMRIARPTNEIQFTLGTSLASPITATFYFGPTVVDTITTNGDGTINLNQTLRFRNDDLFNRVLIVQPGASMRMDGVIVAPRCTWVGTNARNVRLGTSGDDVMCSRGGNDVLDGLDGNDRIVSGSGDDAVRGGQDNDDMFGGPGNDTLNGIAGNDHCDGGAGSDGWANCDLLVGFP